MCQIIHRVQDEIISSSQNASASYGQWFISVTVPRVERFLNRHEVFFGFFSPRVRVGKTMEHDVPAREDGGLAWSGGKGVTAKINQACTDTTTDDDISRSIVSTLTPSLSHFFSAIVLLSRRLTGFIRPSSLLSPRRSQRTGFEVCPCEQSARINGTLESAYIYIYI